MTDSVLTPLLAMTAWFLGLSILVQVLQEMWKFVTSSKSRAYERALADFLGPFVIGRLKQNPLLAVRGPLQFRRVSIAGRILPLNADDLVAAFEKSAPEWQQLVKRAIDFEVAIQKSGPAAPSATLVETVRALARQVEEGKTLAKNSSDRRLGLESLAVGDAGRVYTFLKKWNAATPDSDAPVDAAALQRAFGQEFLPQAETVRRHYDQFLQNFGYQYRRRNLRQTFAFALLVAVALNLPFEQIFLRATAVTPAQAMALAESAQMLYQQADTAADADQARLRELGNQALAIASSANSLRCASRDAALSANDAVVTAQAATRAATAANSRYECTSARNVDYFLDPTLLWNNLSNAETGSPRFLFGCLLTAILVTFGAPFWNDLSSTLLRAARPTRNQQGTAAPDRPVKTEVE
jgi:hypothetical protein